MPYCVGWVTCPSILPYAQSQEDPLLTWDDILAVQWLRERGHQVLPIPWRETPSPPPGLDALVVRSPWDIGFDQPAFWTWLQAFQEASIPIFNGLDVITWNGHKGYLLTLSQKGAPIVPLVCVPQHSERSLGAIAAAQGWDELVVKPAIGAAGMWTYRLTQDELPGFADEWRECLARCDFLVQPFVPEILEEGEWSFLFYGDTYSHAVRKFAKQGEFRVQDDHGGHVALVEAPTALIAQAKSIVALLPFSCLFARVDGVVHQETLHVMEVELIEPELFFRGHPEAPARFGRALFAALEERD